MKVLLRLLARLFRKEKPQPIMYCPLCQTTNCGYYVQGGYCTRIFF